MIENKTKGEIIADRVALPFWIILLIYGFWKINLGDTSAWLIVAIIGGAFIVDFCLVIKSFKN